MNKKELQTLIGTYSDKTFTRNERSEFDLYREYLNEYTVLAMFKYMKGKIEHRDTLEELDCELEIQNELIDINAYQFIKTIQ